MDNSNASPPQLPLRRLVVCFDGTWNTPEDQTNVSRIYAAIADQHSGCSSQLKFYDEGVGTTRGSRLTGGAFGLGLDQNILQAYAWLINEYVVAQDAAAPLVIEDDGEKFAAGPDIFLFGFSRGAYTARSLAGLLNRCGLPRRPEKDGAPVRVGPDWQVVRDAWDLYREKLDAGRDAAQCREFRARHCHDVKVKFIGVWDTVGALGVPMFAVRSPLSRLRYRFHDASLGRVVEHAYHAVAIDEHREDYKVTLWTAKHARTKDVEQRWFPGAHANVGGGYEDDLLPDPPLRWLAKRAIAHGLEFVDEAKLQLARPEEQTCKAELPNDFELDGTEYLSPVRDSYGDFLGGLYRFLRRVAGRGRYERAMLTDGVNETIDETAQMKWAADPRYRPRNLALAGRSESAAARFATPVTGTAAPETSGTV